MNATSNSVVDGESVALTCSLKYRTNAASREENVHIRIELPRAEVISTETQYSRVEINSVVTVKVKSSKNTEEPTQFGPIQCKVDFTKPGNDAELSPKAVQFSSDEMPEFHILCKWLETVLPRDALQCKVRSCYHLSSVSVCSSVCDVGGS